MHTSYFYLKLKNVVIAHHHFSLPGCHFSLFQLEFESSLTPEKVAGPVKEFCMVFMAGPALNNKQTLLPHVIYEANLCVTLSHYPKYNIPPSNSLTDRRKKSLDHEMLVTDPHIFYEVNLLCTLIHYPKYEYNDSHPSKKYKI